MAAVSEREKMVAGELYLAMVPELAAARQAARDLSREFNKSSAVTPDQLSAQLSILKRLVGSMSNEQPPCVEPPFQCDYVSASQPPPPRCLSRTIVPLERYILLCPDPGNIIAGRPPTLSGRLIAGLQHSPRYASASPPLMCWLCGGRRSRPSDCLMQAATCM